MARRIAGLSLAGLVMLAACGFDGAGSGPGAAPDGGGADATSPDGAPIGSDGSAPDGSVDADGAVVPDPKPTHLGGVDFDAAAFDVAGLTAIDTGAASPATPPTTTPALPAGAHIDVKGDYAVLFVGALNVDKAIVVKGSRPLVVVAMRAVIVSASIDAGGKGATAGPGGFANGSGPGKGGNGKASAGTNEDSGGGGGSFGTKGAEGGDTSVTDKGGVPGITYGDDSNVFVGGSPGGEGTPAGACPRKGFGGGGGGAIQISSRVSITVAPGAWINAGGGGGQGGCSDDGKSGGGGGSGGTIFLEARSIVIGGTLAANGGGGGGGGDGSLIGGFDAESGKDGGPSLPAIVAAPGGSNPAEGKGGAGAIEGTAAVKPATAADNNQGGGGGGLGRIWIGTFGSGIAPTVTGISSPKFVAPK